MVKSLNISWYLKQTLNFEQTIATVRDGEVTKVLKKMRHSPLQFYAPTKILQTIWLKNKTLKKCLSSTNTMC